MELAEICAFIRRQRYAVIATVGGDGRPQAVTVGIALTDAGDVIFDTVTTTRKAANLRLHPAIALTIGSLEPDALATVQYEGEATFPSGDALAKTRAEYLRVFPDGHERLSWPGILHVRVRPRWIRFSSFASNPPAIHEFAWEANGGARPGAPHP